MSNTIFGEEGIKQFHLQKPKKKKETEELNPFKDKSKGIVEQRQDAVQSVTAAQVLSDKASPEASIIKDDIPQDTALPPTTDTTGSGGGSGYSSMSNQQKAGAATALGMLGHSISSSDKTSTTMGVVGGATSGASALMAFGPHAAAAGALGGAALGLLKSSRAKKEAERLRQEKENARLSEIAGAEGNAKISAIRANANRISAALGRQNRIVLS